MEWLFCALSEVGCWVEIEEKNPQLLHVMLPLGGTLEICVGNGVTEWYFYKCAVAGRWRFLTNEDCGKKKLHYKGDTIWYYAQHDYRCLPDIVARLNDEEVALRNAAQRRSLVFTGVLRQRCRSIVSKDMAWLLGRTHYTLELQAARESL